MLQIRAVTARMHAALWMNGIPACLKCTVACLVAQMRPGIRTPGDGSRGPTDHESGTADACEKRLGSQQLPSDDSQDDEEIHYMEGAMPEQDQAAMAGGGGGGWDAPKGFHLTRRYASCLERGNLS